MLPTPAKEAAADELRKLPISHINVVMNEDATHVNPRQAFSRCDNRWRDFIDHLNVYLVDKYEGQ